MQTDYAIPSTQLLTQLKRQEGFYATPYLCPAGVATIGYGTSLEAHPRHIPYLEIRQKVERGTLKGRNLLNAIANHGGMTWDTDKATAALLEEVGGCRALLEDKCPQYNRLVAAGEYARAEVLLNMAYNMGVWGLLKFKNTLRMVDNALSGSGSWQAVATGMLNSLWARQVKSRARDLARQMETGVYA